MRYEINYLPPHQNGLIFGLLTAAVMFLFLLIFTIFGASFIFSQSSQLGGANPFALAGGASIVTLFIMPVIYFILTYILTALACLFYNWVCKFTGGMEFELKEKTK